MTMTDPIADMLTRVRNANSAHQDAVSMPFSKLKSHIAEILEAEGYIASWTVEDAEVGKTLTINLKYGPNRERSIAGVRRVQAGLRVTPSPPTFPRCSVASASRSSRRRPDCSPTSRPPTRVGWGKSSPTSGKGCWCRALDASRSPSPRCDRGNVDGQTVTVKGPKGDLTHTVAPRSRWSRVSPASRSSAPTTSVTRARVTA